MGRRPTDNTRRGDPALTQASGYWQRAQWPLQSLYFLMPLLVVYEVGTIVYQPQGRGLPPILAESLLATFLQEFGGLGMVLPVLLVAGVLLTQHVVQQSRQPWRPQWRLYPVMWVESLLLALPLFIFAMVLFRHPGGGAAEAEAAGSAVDAAAWLAAGDGAPGEPHTWFSMILLSLGAGIYEELLFRLMAITLLHLLFVDVLKMKDEHGVWLAVGIAAVAFALYHFNRAQLEEVRDFHAGRLGQLIYFVLAGVYFGLIYALRGYGVVAATHALYDVLYVTAMHWGGEAQA